MATTLKVQQRDINESTGKKMRRNGIIPLMMLGKDVGNVHLQVSARDLESVLNSKEHVFTLDIVGKGSELVLMQEVQRDCISQRPFHISFLKVKRGEVHHVTIPVNIEGDPPGVKEGGVLTHTLREIEVICTPEDTPDSLLFSVGHLELGQVLHLNEVSLPKGVTVDDSHATVEVASVQIQRQEVEPEPVVAEGEPAAADGAEKPAEGSEAPKAEGEKKDKKD